MMGSLQKTPRTWSCWAIWPIFPIVYGVVVKTIVSGHGDPPVRCLLYRFPSWGKGRVSETRAWVLGWSGVEKVNFGDSVYLVSEVDALLTKSWSLLEGRYPGAAGGPGGRGPGGGGESFGRGGRVGPGGCGPGGGGESFGRGGRSPGSGGKSLGPVVSSPINR